MLDTYQAKIINNKLQWLDTPPDLQNADVIVTVLPKTTQTKRKMPEILKGRGETIGDIMDTSDMTSGLFNQIWHFKRVCN